MNIYIPIEIKVRELEGRVLLALAAAERGHVVVVGEKKDTIVKASRGEFPPGLVHMKSITPHDSMIESLTNLRKQGHKITVQDEESGLLDDSYDTFARLRFSEQTIQMVDRVFTWGHYDYRSLEKMYGDQIDKFSITGSPRVDFWRKDFHDYYANIEEAATIDGKPYFMVVSNFSGPLNVNPFWNVMARLNKAGYFDREDGRERHEFENAAYQTRLIGEFVFLIRELAVTYPDYNILVRPHPVESIEGWSKLIGDVPNVVVQRDGTISRWIRHAEVIIHNGCTSALEAAIAGENRIAYRPIPHEIEREIPNKVSLNAYTIDEVKSLIGEMLEGKDLHRKDENYEDIQSLIKDRFEAIDDELAADRIVDVWDEISNSISKGNNCPEDFQDLSYQHNPSLIKLIKKTAKNVRNKLSSKSGSGKSKRLLKSHHKFPKFTDEEMEALHENLKITLNRFESVTYKRLGRKSFLIYNKEIH